VSLPWRSVGWVGVGVGSGVLALSGVLGLVAAGKRSSFQEESPARATFRGTCAMT